MLRRIDSGFLFAEETGYSNSYSEYEDNFSALKVEENVVDQLNNLHVQEDDSYNINNENNLTMVLLKYMNKNNLSVELSDDGKFADLIHLLRKWCLEGPYDINESVFFCYSRGRNVNIANTVRILDAYIWRQLALIVKEYLVYQESNSQLVRLSPMFRYYGDLYPDNGRDEDLQEEELGVEMQKDLEMEIETLW
jgi:hypothetical protein